MLSGFQVKVGHDTISGGAEGGVSPPNTTLEKKTYADYINVHCLYRAISLIYQL